MSKEATNQARRKRKEKLVRVHGGKCALCGYNRCIGALQFHHINPSEKQYGLSNGNCHSWEQDLEESKKCILVCGNCHQEIHRGLIDHPLTTSYNQEIADIETEEINTIKGLIKIENKESDKNSVVYVKKTNCCEKCGKEITRGAKYCPECYAILNRKVERPTKEELKQMLVDNLGNFTNIGRKFGVVDNTIRKWCRGYGLPTHSSDYKPKKPDKKPFEGYNKIGLIENEQIIKVFENGQDAARWLKQQDDSISANESSISTNINRVCKGQRKTCYKRKWKYV